jgi:uncharacterized membrane protein YbhN (UPF0104 family)
MESDKTEKKTWVHRCLPVFILAVFSAALWALHREISHFRMDDFRAYIRSLSFGQISIAVLATIGGYLALMCYDWFGMRYVKQKLSTLRIAVTAFIGYAFSMNIGHSILSGGAVRMRLYTSWGIGVVGRPSIKVQLTDK